MSSLDKSTNFKRSFVVHNLISFFILFLIIYIIGYNYFTHLLMEILSVFMSFIIFTVLIAIPYIERSPFLQILGITFLSMGILDIPHMFYYPGLKEISNTSYSISYWMLARGIQAIGLIIATYHKNFLKIDKKYEKLSFLLPLLALLLAFTPKYLPYYLFYHPEIGTTFLKSLLEGIYSLSFLFFAFKNRNNKYLLLSGIFFALSELSFVKYFSPFDWNLWVGHIFKVLGIFNIGFYVLVQFVYNPLKDYRHIGEKYKKEGEKLSKSILDIVRIQNGILEFLRKALTLKNEEDLIKLLINFFDRENINIACFVNNRIVYNKTSHQKLEDFEKEKYEIIENNNVIILIEKKEEPFLQLYKLLIYSLFSIFDNIKYTRKLEVLEKERKDYIRKISHEFRNPLSVILGYLQLIEKGSYKGSPEELKEIVKEMLFSSLKISELIDKLIKVGDEDGKDISGG